MATFAYSGRARGGQVVNGEFMADTVDAAVAALRREQILVTKINPVKDKRAEARRKVGTRSVKAKDLAVFTRQFSVMIGAGLPLVQCLEILGTQAEDKKFGEVILATRADVEAGASLADAMKKHPKVFDSLFTNMIAAGEAGGILDAILKRLATYIEKNVKLKSQVKSAMVYPVAVIVIATVVVAAILWKVIPTFASLFAGLGADLPLPTRIVIALSDFLVAYMPVIIGTIVAISFALRAYYRTVGGRMMIDRLVLKMPVLGMLMRKIAVARFCRTLSTLLASGVSILEALDITARTAGNAVVEQALFATRKSIEGGDTVAGPLRQTDVFPPMVVQMIGVGEATGALDTMLAKIADFYEDEVDVAVAGLLTLLEPLMISLLGGVVGGIVIAMYLPIFSLISQLTGG
ncbi:MAG: pilus assembly protein PilC [Acidobacteria bacterium RIFCSPLOWO2_12_FULL_67_14]|nr:MAG: pilus assembly protein PilC [Acidobacteria bacterium RIFCSPLOWO2_12_FULL_67_14]